MSTKLKRRSVRLSKNKFSVPEIVVQDFSDYEISGVLASDTKTNNQTSGIESLLVN
jgi:hypothetical protein